MAAESLAVDMQKMGNGPAAKQAKTLAVYDGGNRSKVFAEALAPCADSLVLLNLSQESTLNAPGELPIRTASDYVPGEMRKALVEQSYRLAQTWYQDLPSWFHCQDGICFGEIASYDLVILFIDALIAVASAKQIIAKEQPKEIVLPEGASIALRAFEHVARMQGIAVRKVAAGWQPAQTDSLLPDVSLIAPQRFLAIALWGWLRALARTAASAKTQSKPHRFLATDFFRLRPAMESIQKSGKASVWWLGGSSQSLKRSLSWSGKTGSLAALGYLSFPAWFSCLRFSEEVTNHWHGFLTRMAPKFDWQGINLLDIIAVDFGQYVQTVFPNWRALLAGSESLIKKEKITAITVHQDLQGYYKLLVECGKKLGLRTICFQHGIDPDIPDYGHHASGEYAVWGESTKALCQRRQKIGKEGRIVVAGDPFLGRARQTYDREAIRKRFGCFSSQKLIVMSCERYVNHYAAFDRPQTPNRHLEAVCRTVNQLPGGLLIARCKARRVYNEFGGDFETKLNILKQRLPHRASVDTETPLHELLAAADAVIVTYSTIGLEAMVLNKPVIYLNFEGSGSDLMGYEASGAVLTAHTEEQLQKALSDVLNNRVILPQGAKESFLAGHLANLGDREVLQRIDACLTGSGK